MSVRDHARIEAQPDRLRDLVLLAGRILIAAVFIYDATLLVRFPASNMAFMEQFGLPGVLLYPTALFQFLGGLAIVFGLWLRPVALAFAGFCVLTAVVFHRDFAIASELIQFGKDIGLSGGFLIFSLPDRPPPRVERASACRVPRPGENRIPRQARRMTLLRSPAAAAGPPGNAGSA